MPPDEDDAPLLRIRLRVTNTSRDTHTIPQWMTFVRLPDRSVLPTEHDSVFFRRTGPAEILPLIPADGTLTYADGIPTERPDEVEVIIIDEVLAPRTGVYTETYVPGDPLARVVVPVTEGTR